MPEFRDKKLAVWEKKAGVVDDPITAKDLATRRKIEEKKQTARLRKTTEGLDKEARKKQYQDTSIYGKKWSMKDEEELKYYVGIQKIRSDVGR